MAIRFMLDSDNLADLSPVAEVLATYSDLVADPASLRAKFPHSVVVLIDRGAGDPSGEASVFDIERGTLTVSQAVAAYDAKAAKGVRYLTVYGSRDAMPAINAAFGARPMFRWIATLDGTSHIAGIRALHGPAAIQCLSADELGVHADGSLVFEDGWNPGPHADPLEKFRQSVTEIHANAEHLTQRLTQLADRL